MHECFGDIAESKHWQKVEFFDKGWSSDRKYCIETDDGRKLIIRVADISQYQRKVAEYKAIMAIRRLGLEMSQPIDFGTCADGREVYILLSWVEGQSLEVALPLLDTKEQYDLGVAAGTMLRRIHSISAPEGQLDWEGRMLTKINKRTTQYLRCGYRVPNEETLMRFINGNLHYLKNRPQTLQHGDFHPGNLILTSGKQLGIVDFNRTDYGDPWEEFVRVPAFTKNVSIPFALGQIKGYFNGPVPQLFFQLLALYSAIDAHFGVVWAIPFGQAEIDSSVARSRSVYEDFNGFETCIPVWYK
jgi:aminoglycoside phosphotransferase (APT) family kinase protein